MYNTCIYALQDAIFDRFSSNSVQNSYCISLDKFVGQNNPEIFTPIVGGGRGVPAEIEGFGTPRRSNFEEHLSLCLF